MKNMKDEIELTSDLLKVKKLMRSLQQISYSAKKTEDRFPEIEFASEEDMLTYIRTCLAYKYDIAEILDSLNKVYKKYATRTE